MLKQPFVMNVPCLYKYKEGNYNKEVFYNHMIFIMFVIIYALNVLRIIYYMSDGYKPDYSNCHMDFRLDRDKDYISCIKFIKE